MIIPPLKGRKLQTAQVIACEVQTYFWSSLLSLRNYRRERSDNQKYVCTSQATQVRAQKESKVFTIKNYA